MLNWFNTAKVDHPLAGAKEGRRVVADLPRDTFKAMTEIAFWLDSVNTTPGFRLDRRLELVDQFDQAARPHLRKLAQDYLQVRQQKFQEHRVWMSLSEFWRLVGDGYVVCIEGFQADAAGAGSIKPRLAAIVGRALHARAQRLKWLMQRYGPIESALWADLGRLYAFAEAKRIADGALPFYEGAPPSSPRQELLRALMLAAASSESLLPEQIDLAERSVAFLAPRFVISAAPEPGCTHVFDCAMAQAPQRNRSGQQDSSVRHFGAGGAYDELSRLLGVLRAEGALPSDVALGALPEPGAVEAVWRHLLQYWSAQAPERRSERRAANVRLTVIPGFNELMAALEGTRADTLDFSGGQNDGRSESWVVENASNGGYGALVPASGSDWLQVGALIAVKAESESRWSAGVVRRMLREDGDGYRVGIELLAQPAFAARLAPAGAISSFNATRDNDPAVLLTRKPDADRQVRMLLRAGTYTAGQTLEIRVRGQAVEAAPARLVESTSEYDLAVFTLLRRVA